MNSIVAAGVKKSQKTNRRAYTLTIVNVEKTTGPSINYL